MQAVILAAGMGRRLGELTEKSTKCMVKVNGRRLIEHTMDALLSVDVRRMVVVIGHGGEELQSFLLEHYPQADLHFVTNSIYAHSNNIHSVLLAQEFLESEDTLLLESDVLFESGLLAECLAHPSPNIAMVARYEPWMDGTVVMLDQQSQITRFISRDRFDWAHADQYYKTVNIYKLSSSFCRSTFVPFLSAYTRSRGISEYYEDVLKVLVFINSDQLTAMPVGDLLWYEIDDVQDLEIAGVLFAEDGSRYDRLLARYGGYWRFPRLTDYCYLVNPYFPPDRLVQELGSALPTLLSHYPSGQDVQNRLAARMFHCRSDFILAANGAAELIAGLMPLLDGKIGLAVPTFDEYRRTAPEGLLIPFHPHRPDFRYTTDDLLEFCTQNRPGALVLINPDNPTGQFISRDEVLELAASLRQKEIRLVVDESFVDFVDGEDTHTLIDDRILLANPNLTVVKSISKSYGAPGCRLGVLATADAGLLGKVRATLPIWNINSIGECFMQIINKYEADFRAGCRLLAQERDRFAQRLAEVSGLRPMSSSANYVLCEVLGQSADAVARKLLEDHWLLVKNCSGKLGLSRGQYIRFAVREKAENELLIECLKGILTG